MTKQLTYKEAIKHFINTLEQDKNFNSTLFKENLTTLTITDNFDNLFLKIINYKKRCKDLGQYDYTKNRISVFDNELSTLFHELLHMASTKYYEENKFAKVGFAAYNKSKKIQANVALNEGYTEFLNTRYFYNFIKKNSGEYYEIEKFLSSIIENIVGRNLMTKSYFKATIKPVVNALYNYGNINDLKLFLNDSEYIADEPSDINIHKFLLPAYQFKLIENLINKEITTDELITLISFYCIRFKIDEKKEAIDLLNNDYKDKVLKKIRY